MKKLVFVFVLLILAGGYFFRGGLNFMPEREYMLINAGEGELILKPAVTSFEKSKGLQDTPRLGLNRGMIFLYKEPSILTFWNKDLLVDLDVIWVRGSEVIGVDFLPKESERGIVRISSPSAADTVIEVGAGWAEKYGVIPGSSVSGINRSVLADG